MKNETLMLDI